MKHLFFVCLINLFAPASDVEFDFVHIQSSLDDFEIIDSFSSYEWSDLSAYYFRKLPSTSQRKIIEPCLSKFFAYDIWNLVYLVDKSFKKEYKTIKDSSLIRKKELFLYNFEVEYESFLFSAFRSILHCYKSSTYKNYRHDLLVLNRLGTVAQESFRKHVYLEWPYCLQKFSTFCLHDEIRKVVKPSLDNCDYRLKGFEVNKIPDGFVFTRRIYQNFENSQRVFLCALTGLLLLNCENKENILEEYSPNYREYIKNFLDTQTNTTDYLTVSSLNLRIEVEKLFHILRISVNA